MTHSDDTRFEAWWNHSEARRGLSEAAKGLARSVWFAALEDEDQRLAAQRAGDVAYRQSLKGPLPGGGYQPVATPFGKPAQPPRQ